MTAKEKYVLITGRASGMGLLYEICAGLGVFVKLLER